MNRLIKTYLSPVILLLLAFGACKKEVVFEGKDNYIQTFSLQKAQNTYNANITGELIRVKASEGISLEGAKLTIKLSERAKIYPDPASVTNWNDEQQFVVTASNGTKKTYKYTVERTSILSGNSVMLTTQADVDEFSKKGVTEIAGSLIIGDIGGMDSIRNISGLSTLKKIGYSLIINSTYAGTDLSGLGNIETVGDAIQIESAPNLNDVKFQQLETVNSITATNLVFQVFTFPKLSQVNKAISINSPVAEFNVPNLRKVGGMMTILNYSSTLGDMTSLSFPALTEANGILVNRLNFVRKISFPMLTKNNGDINLSILRGTYAISFPKLEENTGKLIISNTIVTEVSLPVLKQIGGVSLDDKTINVLEMPQLTTINGNLEVANLNLLNINGFNALTDVKGSLVLSNMPRMTTFSLPPALKHIGKLSIVANTVTLPVLSPINIKGISVDELDWQGAGSVTMIADESFKGILTLGPRALATFPVFQGFSEIDSLNVAPSFFSSNNLNMIGIKKIRKGFSLPNNSLFTFAMPDLEEVGGNLTIPMTSQNLTQTSIELPKLKKVGGNFGVTVQTRGPVTILRCGLLTDVGGNMNIGTGYTTMSLANLDFPMLQNIGGTLSIFSASTTNLNTKLTDLSGFSALKSVKGISVTGQSVLTSYLGLKDAMASFGTSNWTVARNSYNPTYSDLASGKWTK